MKKLRLGIVGTGSIVKRVMTDMGNCENMVLTAFASRTLERAKEFADKYGAEYVFGSYEEMAASDKIDIVYIATPNNCHCENACLFMNNKKHVICEKPLAMNGEEARRIVECAKNNNVFFMEAMWTRFMPAIVEVIEKIKSGAIGEVKHIYGDFSYASRFDETSRIYDPKLGGGALMDVGVYPLMLITYILGYKPETISGHCACAPSGVDARTSMYLRYENGATAELFCGVDCMSRSDFMIYGTNGAIHIPQFWHAEAYDIQEGFSEVKQITFRHETEGHHYEFDHAAECINSGLLSSPVITPEESIAIADMVEDIRLRNGVLYPTDNK